MERGRGRQGERERKRKGRREWELKGVINAIIHVIR